jgi:hypothetical protein
MSLVAYRVPPEVWRPVFEEVLGENGPSYKILPVISVCTDWKVCALRNQVVGH